MKHFALGILLLVTVTSIALAHPLLASAASSANNFTIENYEIDYYLDRGSDGHSKLKTVESITAVFPETDQNHGIERAIPAQYDGHQTHLKVESVVDQSNQSYNYTTYSSHNNTVVRIGDADSYVHGAKTYTLTYTQSDVTKYFTDTGRDEFYWDTNGTDWRVPITLLTARLHLASSLRGATTGDTACYLGSAGSTENCNITRDSDSYTVMASNLSPSQNATIAVGFTAHYFIPYKASLAERLIGIAALLALLSVPFAVIAIIWFTLRYQRRSNRSSELSTIIPEYLPPADTSVATAAAISNKPTRSFSAQLIDFAVRGYLKIYETRQKSFWRSAQYELEITKDIRSLKDEEQELFRDIFDDTAIGTKLDMASMKKNYGLAAKLQDNPQKLRASIAGGYGLRARDEAQSKWFKRAGFITLGVAALSFSPALLVAAIVAFAYGALLKPLTDKGLALARYLKGLEMYIKVAEEDRLRMLQSPEGALKVGAPVTANDTRQLIKLYERVLPYAILFGQEKDWNKRLGNYYQSANQSPTWYNTNSGVFNAAVFSSAIGNFNSAATYSNPSSSSSGGSGGGGSSGGGGGGGGGGGW